MKTINRDGFTLHYTQEGNINSSPILVIGSSIYYPKLFIDDIYQDLNLIFIDHRGFSKPEEENIYDLKSIVEDIDTIRIKLKLDKFYLLGHSGHGFMAMAYEEEYPEHVEGVILSNLAPTNNKERQDQSIQYFESTASEDRKQYFYKEIAKLESDIKKDPDNRFSHMNRRMQAHAFYDYKYDGFDLWNGVYNNMDALDHLWGEAFAIFDTKSYIENTKTKILLILSDYDYLVAPANLWDDIIKNKNISLIKFDQSGHNPMLEEPEKYHRSLKQFIEKM